MIRADGCRPRQSRNGWGAKSSDRISLSNTCALRAPTVFSVRIKAIRTENAVIDKTKQSAEDFPSAEHPVLAATGHDSIGQVTLRSSH
jgi:hypothetical protein